MEVFTFNTQSVPFHKKQVSHIEELLLLTKEMDASDLHLSAYSPPAIRVGGYLMPVKCPSLTPEEIRRLIEQLLTPRQREVLEERKAVDLAVEVSGMGRFRINSYYQRGFITAAIRRLADRIPELETLGLPPSVWKLADLKDGLVLVTGTTGSGKTTTLAAIIERINATSRRNIIPIEDPIEYQHFNRQSIINQRELYSDVPSFFDGLRSALRADPEVILVGEMRDLDTMRTAVMAAETGHLVFSTLHSRDAVSSITRVLGIFSPEEQNQIKQQLSISLRAVISQQLLPRADAPGLRVLASEVMFITPAISNLIRLGKLENIFTAIETGKKHGMQTTEQSLLSLYKKGLIDYRTALQSARNPSFIKEKIGTS